MRPEGIRLDALVCGIKGIAKLRKLRQIEEETPKQPVTDLTLDKHMRQEALQKSSEAD